MLKVNGNEIEYEEGITVASLLDKLGFVFPMLVVRVNGALVDRKDFKRRELTDRDEIDVIHLMSGG